MRVYRQNHLRGSMKKSLQEYRDMAQRSRNAMTPTGRLARAVIDLCGALEIAEKALEDCVYDEDWHSSCPPYAKEALAKIRGKG